MSDENKDTVMTNNTVTVLWTGGWDSTYRMVELSFRDVTVQPIYIVDPHRISTQNELCAMQKILELLRSKEKTKAAFLPIIQIKLEDIPENKEITEAFLVFQKEADMGSQHDWLARLALKYPMMELCIEKALGDHAPIRQSIMRHGSLIDTGDGFIINKEVSSKELNLVLGNLKLPIFEKTELDMLENIKNWQYEDVMSNIWFCHQPIKGKPCGMCNPCTTKMTSNMAFLLPPKAQKRNIMHRKITKLLGKKCAELYRLGNRFILKRF